MNEYKVVYWEDTAGDFAFETSVHSKFQQEINQNYSQLDKAVLEIALNVGARRCILVQIY